MVSSCTPMLPHALSLATISVFSRVCKECSGPHTPLAVLSPLIDYQALREAEKQCNGLGSQGGNDATCMITPLPPDITKVESSMATRPMHCITTEIEEAETNDSISATGHVKATDFNKRQLPHALPNSASLALHRLRLGIIMHICLGIVPGGASSGGVVRCVERSRAPHCCNIC